MEPINVLALCDGEYEVHSNGLVFSNKKQEKKELIGRVGKHGYRTVLLTVNGRRIYKNVHRIVAENFIPNPNDLPQVNHKDGNKLNNRVDNLEWVDSRSNLIHARDNNLLNTTKINMHMANQIREFKKKNPKMSHREIAPLFGICKTEVGYILNNKRWMMV